ncbi:MAG: PadR family transcriptional regulator [Anaerolineae bacterium]|nr:PadR family transcriptional regulator [Anaerolineae bacterium]
MNEAELTILSLLSEGARFGHDLHTVIEERGLRQWITIGFSSIYYLLNKLERQQMLRSELRLDASGVARKFYTLTDAGRGILQTAIADLLRQPRALGSGFELGLANLHVLKPAQVYQTLSHHLADLRGRYEAIAQSWQRHQSETLISDTLRALYTHNLQMMQAEIHWLEGFINDWLARYPEANRPATQPRRDDADPSESQAATKIHRRTTPQPAKQLQRIKRPPKEE